MPLFLQSNGTALEVTRRHKQGVAGTEGLGLEMLKRFKGSVHIVAQSEVWLHTEYPALQAQSGECDPY